MRYRNDKVRKALEPFLPNLLIFQEGSTGCTVASNKINFRDEQWYEVTKIVRGLGGDWVNAHKFMKGHWRIPKS